MSRGGGSDEQDAMDVERIERLTAHQQKCPLKPARSHFLPSFHQAEVEVRSGEDIRMDGSAAEGSSQDRHKRRRTTAATEILKLQADQIMAQNLVIQHLQTRLATWQSLFGGDDDGGEHPPEDECLPDSGEHPPEDECPSDVRLNAAMQAAIRDRSLTTLDAAGACDVAGQIRDIHITFSDILGCDGEASGSSLQCEFSTGSSNERISSAS